MNQIILRRLFVFLLLISGTNMLFAQETTATLSGIINDEKGAPVAGATVTAIHDPTGFRTGTQSNSKGLFVLPNLKPGGPYTISISFIGYEEQKFENVNLGLGSNPQLNLNLKNNDKAL